MFEILPIKSIREEDTPLIGRSLSNLAILYHHGLNVPEGIIVMPPKIKLNTFLEHYRAAGKEIFEQSLHLIKKDLAKIKLPPELEKELNKHQLDSEKIWREFLEIWLQQLRVKIWQEGFSPNIIDCLLGQSVFYTKKVLFSFNAYFDFVEKITVIESSHALTSEQELEIDKQVKKANKTLYLPYIYTFIFDGIFQIVKVSEFTQYPKNETKVENEPIKIISKTAASISKSTIKVYIDLTDSLVVKSGVDGLLMRSNPKKDFDDQVFRLVSMAMDFPALPVVFKLTDMKDEQIRGALRLLHDPALLKKQVDVFLFARNKKSLFNTQIAVPTVRSSQEFMQLKRDLSSMGVSRKGSLKLWLQLAVPENFINIGDYINAGFDGALIDLDELSALIGGFDLQKEEGMYYQKQVKALIIFIDETIKVLKKNNIPILFEGNLALHDELIRLIAEKGIYGLVANLTDAFSIHDHLRFVENRLIKSRMVV